MTTHTDTPSTQKKADGLFSARFALVALIPAFLMPILIHQPREVVAAVFSGVVAAGAMLAGGVFEKRGKLGAAREAVAICAVFTVLFVVCSYLTCVA